VGGGNSAYFTFLLAPEQPSVKAIITKVIAALITSNVPEKFEVDSGLFMECVNNALEQIKR